MIEHKLFELYGGSKILDKVKYVDFGHFANFRVFKLGLILEIKKSGVNHHVHVYDVAKSGTYRTSHAEVFDRSLGYTKHIHATGRPSRSTMGSRTV